MTGSLADEYDVVVGGSGIAGSTTSMILSDSGLDVLLLEAETHPRFAIGEGLLPQSTMWLWIVGEYFDVPEIQYLSDADKVVEHVTQSCGIKHSFGFAYHERGRPFDGEQAHQLIPPEMPFYSESHLLRRDVDHYLVESAEEYGVDYVDETPITDVEIGEEAVTVTTEHGTTNGAFYVDATGSNSVLAEKLGYRNGGPELDTDSRAIFAHVEGLEPFDDLIADRYHPGQSNRLHDGTLQHVFDGGWLWVIPFDNFERSDSTRASVGLLLDRDEYPLDESVDAEEEFHRIVAEFPGIERHLDGVEPVMPWIRTGRLQRSSGRSSGRRHYLTNSTYGFVDPLYSVGLVHTLESVFVGTNLLLEAFEDGDFSADRFESLDELHRRQLEDADFFISNAYRAMGDFAVWNAWTQMALGEILFEDAYIQRHCFKYFETGRPAEFDRLLREARPGDEAPFVADSDDMFRAIAEALDAYVADEMGPDETAEVIFGEMRAADWLPKHVYPWGDERARHVDFSDPDVAEKLLTWGMTDSPEHIREGLFDFELPEMP